MAELLNRRAFLRTSAAGGAAVLIAACQPQIVKETVVVEKPVEKVVEKVVKETVIVKGDTEVVEKAVQEVVTATPAPPLKATLQVMTYPYGDDDLAQLWGPMGDRFSEAYPDVDVKIDLIPWSGRREKLYTAFAAGSPPDVFHADSDTVEAYGAKKVVLPLQDLVSAEVLSDYDPVNVKIGTYGGDLVILPVLQKCAGPAHNATMMEECGLDPVEGVATWDEILALGEAAKSKGYFADSIVTAGSNGWQYWLLWLRSANGSVYGEDGNSVTLREQPAIDALNYWKTLYDSGFIPVEGIGGDLAANYFAEQSQVTLFRAGESLSVTLPQQVPGFPFTESRPRQMTANHKPISGYGAMRGWAVTRISKNVDAALEWVKYQVRPDMIGLFCSIAKQIPTGPKARSYWSSDESIINHVKMHNDHLWFNQDSYTFWQESKVACRPHFEAAVLGLETVEEALDLAAQELEALIADRQANA